MAVALLCACNGKESCKKVSPILADVNLENIQDATLSACFTVDDFNWTDAYLTLTLYSEDIYRSEDIEALQTGDTLVLGGDNIIVNKLTRDGNSLMVNDGIEEGGAELELMDGSNDIWRSYLLDDHFSYEEIGKAKFHFDENLIISDCGSEPDDPTVTIQTDQKAFIDQLPEYKKTFSELDTKVEIKDNKIISITRTWIP